MGDRAFFHQSRLTLTAAMLAVIATGCLGTTTQRSSTSSSGGFSPSTTTTSKSSTDPCARFDASNPLRSYCQDCSARLIATNCAPGVTSVSGCVDASFRDRYANLVNQCVNERETVGNCTRVCSSGQVLNSATCTCEAATSGSTGSGAAGQGLIDNGQFDAGPPVVRLVWNANSVSTSPHLTSPTTEMNGVSFEVRNRGGSHPRDNFYQALDYFCEDPNTGTASGIGSVGNRISTVTFDTPRGATVTSRFTLSSGGITYARRGFSMIPSNATYGIISTSPTPVCSMWDIACTLGQILFGSPTILATYPVFSIFDRASTDDRFEASLGQSNRLGAYFMSGALPASQTDRAGDTTDNTGLPFWVDLADHDSAEAGAGFADATYPADGTNSPMRYNLMVEALALDGWSGTQPGATQERLEMVIDDNGTPRAVSGENGRTNIAIPANGVQTTITQNVPTFTQSTAYLDGNASTEYKFSLSQFRDGQDLEGVATCTDTGGLPCSSDSVLTIGLDNIPKSALRFNFQRKTSAAAFPIEQRLGMRDLRVEPANGYPRCSIKYQFRDANLQSAYYCLVFEAQTRCGVKPDGTAACTVTPSMRSNAESGIGFFPVAQSQKCFCKRYDSNGDGSITAADNCCIPEDTNQNGIYDSGDSCVAGSL